MIFTRRIESSSPSSNTSFQSAWQIRNFGPTQDRLHLFQSTAGSGDRSKIFAAFSGTHRVGVHRSVIIEADKQDRTLAIPPLRRTEFAPDRAPRRSAQMLVSTPG